MMPIAARIYHTSFLIAIYKAFQSGKSLPVNISLLAVNRVHKKNLPQTGGFHSESAPSLMWADKEVIKTVFDFQFLSH